MDNFCFDGALRLLTSAYDFEGYNTQEIWCKISSKINEIITEFKKIDENFNNLETSTNEKLDYLLNDGLQEEVATKIIEYVNNGIIGELINETLLKDITNSISVINNHLSNIDNDKMDKNTKDISITQINKNLGKLDETYMSESLLTKMAGQGTFGSIPEDKSITTNKLAPTSVKANNTDFIKTKHNDLLANVQFINDKYISYITGEESPLDGYKCTDFIAVEEGKMYKTNQSNHMAYYNSQKTFLKGQQGGTWNNTITIPTGVSYIRLSYKKEGVAYLYEVNANDIYPLETLKANEEFEKLIKRLSSKAIKDIPLIRDVYKSIYDIKSLVEYETLIKNGYYTKDGWNVSSSYNSSMFLEVDPLTTYYSNETNIVVMYDNDFIPIKQLWSSAQWETDKKFTTTADTKYITINYSSSNIQPLLFKADDNKISDKYINETFIDLLIKSINDKNKKLELKSIKPFNVIKNATNIYNPSLDEEINTAIKPDTGAIFKAEGYQASGFIKINSSHICMTQRHNIAFYDVNKSYISGYVGGRWYNPLVVPENAVYLRTTFSLSATEPRQINEGATLLDYEHPDKVDISLDDSQLGIALQKLFGSNETARSKLEGITWNIEGDSMSSTNYSRPNWWEIIKNKYNMTVNNYGISGTTFAHYDERHLWDYDFKKLDGTAIGYNPSDSSTWKTGNCMCERYRKMSDKADLITVMGMTNDGNVKLGTWNSNDTSTTYGALNELITGLIKKYPDKKIALFTPIQTANCYKTNVANPSAELDKKQANDTTTLQLKAEAIKRKCKQYGIPCLDLFHISGINGVEGRKELLYRNNDVLHLSVMGNEWIEIVVENFILSLF